MQAWLQGWRKHRGGETVKVPIISGSDPKVEVELR